MQITLYLADILIIGPGLPFHSTKCSVSLKKAENDKNAQVAEFDNLTQFSRF